MDTPDEHWNGFEPKGYEINWKALSQAPLTEIGEGDTRVQTTAGAVLREALPHLFKPFNEGASQTVAPARQPCQIQEGISGDVTIKLPNRTIRLDTLGNGSSFAADLVATVITIAEPEPGPLRPIFFYYDHDHVVDDLHESFSFFVTNNDRIVLDRVTFSRHDGSGFDPQMLTPSRKVKNRIWESEPFVEDAKVRWWYRRFYEETDAGRLTLLREDADFHHYVPEWKQRQSMAASLEQIVHNLAQLQRLVIYTLIALGLIVIALLR